MGRKAQEALTTALKDTQMKKHAALKRNIKRALNLDAIYRVGQKSRLHKLLILSEYVNKTEKIGGM